MWGGGVGARCDVPFPSPFLGQILHGEQYVELKGRIPTSGRGGVCLPMLPSFYCLQTGTLYSEGRITDVLDKKSGALVLVDGMLKGSIPYKVVSHIR